MINSLGICKPKKLNGYYQKQQEISIGEDVKKLKHLYIADETVKWYNHCGNSVMVPQK